MSAPSLLALLSSVEEADKEATPGPWRNDHIVSRSFQAIRSADDPPTRIVAVDAYPRDAAFISLSRTALPALARAVRLMVPVVEYAKYLDRLRRAEGSTERFHQIQKNVADGRAALAAFDEGMKE